MKIIKIYKGKIQTWIQAHLCTYIIQNKHLIFIESVSKYNPLETLTQVILFYFIINKHMKALRSLGISISCFLCLLYNRRHLVYNHQFFGALLKNTWLCTWYFTKHIHMYYFISSSHIKIESTSLIHIYKSFRRSIKQRSPAILSCTQFYVTAKGKWSCSLFLLLCFTELCQWRS